MNTTLEHIKLKAELSQSEVFGNLYEGLLENTLSNAFSNPLIEDISELYNNILLKFEKLTDFQKEILTNIFNEFNNIRINIDPNRLKPFEYYYNADEELLLYRETKSGLINIIINADECLAFSYIPKGDEKRVFYFLQQNGDFEKLAYNFFSF